MLSKKKEDLKLGWRLVGADTGGGRENGGGDRILLHTYMKFSKNKNYYKIF